MSIHLSPHLGGRSVDTAGISNSWRTNIEHICGRCDVCWTDVSNIFEVSSFVFVHEKFTSENSDKLSRRQRSRKYDIDPWQLADPWKDSMCPHVVSASGKGGRHGGRPTPGGGSPGGAEGANKDANGLGWYANAQKGHLPLGGPPDPLAPDPDSDGDGPGRPSNDGRRRRQLSQRGIKSWMDSRPGWFPIPITVRDQVKA
eukprot:4131981-Amphidinium_carterae.1